MFLNFLIIFVIGSILGWLIELIFRRVCSHKKWTNPGFLKGPYLPIYGFGLILFFLISEIPINSNYLINFIVKLLLFIIITSSLELLSGLFIKWKFKISLWDYSSNLFNYKGIICLRYSFCWMICGAIYYLFIHYYLKKFLDYFNLYHYLYFFVGIIIGAIIIETIKKYKEVKQK